MIKPTKKELFEITYQFLGAGMVFWLAILTDLGKGFTANVVYPLEFIGIDTGFILGSVLIPLILIFGIVILYYRAGCFE